MMRTTRVFRPLVLALTVLLGAADWAAAQFGRGGFAPPRMEILEDNFSLDRDQQRVIERLMDEAGDSAESIREGLAKARPAIVEAIQAGKPQPEVDAAVRAYATEAAAMAELEMRTLAKLMEALTPEQRENVPAVTAAFLLIRGAFVGKNWNEAPNPDKGY